MVKLARWKKSSLIAFFRFVVTIKPSTAEIKRMIEMESNKKKWLQWYEKIPKRSLFNSFYDEEHFFNGKSLNGVSTLYFMGRKRGEREPNHPRLLM